MAFSNSATFFTGIGFAHDTNIRCISSESGEPTNGPYQVFITAWLDGELIHDSTEVAGSSPEISYNAGGNGGYSIPIPQDDDGNYKSGTYKFRFYIWDEDTAAFVAEYETEVEWSANVQEDSTISDDLDFTASYDCITGLITATDATTNAGWDTPIGRSISCAPPPTPTDTTPTILEETSTGLTTDPVTFAFDYTNATYVVALQIVRALVMGYTPIIGDGIVVSRQELIGKSISLNIQCDTTLCDIAACYEDEFTELETLACGGGGWGNLTSRQKARLEYVIAMDTVRSLYAAPGCQNINKAAEYADKIKDFLNCGCGCDNTDQPIPYTAPGA